MKTKIKINGIVLPNTIIEINPRSSRFEITVKEVRYRAAQKIDFSSHNPLSVELTNCAGIFYFDAIVMCAEFFRDGTVTASLAPTGVITEQPIGEIKPSQAIDYRECPHCGNEIS